MERRSSVRAEVDGKAVDAEVAWLRAGPRLIAMGDAEPELIEAVDVVWAGEEAFVLHAGQQLRVTFPDPLGRRSENESGGGEVSVPMNGRVASVSVAAGDQVVKGAPLFTVEAMKMEHAVIAPVAGTVQAVRIASGAQVEQGASAVSINPDEPVGSVPVE